MIKIISTALTAVCQIFTIFSPLQLPSGFTAGVSCEKDHFFCMICTFCGYFYVMIAFANCKINLGLFVTSKRTDGYHNIESVFYPVNWADVIEVEKNKGAVKCELVEYGKKVGGDPQQNLCYKAYQLLDKKLGLPSVKLHVFKNLPTGAGLGGGSSNGTVTLKLLNRYFGLELTSEELTQMAVQLGSDCPFFVENQPAMVKGRGEILLPLSVNLSDFYMVLVHPGIHVSTAEAYSMIKPQEIDFDLGEKLLSSGVDTWKNFLRNDFEGPVFSKFPAIAEIKNKMYETGAVFSMMSGSGSAVYGLFEREKDARKTVAQFPAYISKIVYPVHHLVEFAV